MTRFKVQDMTSLENAPASAASLRTKISQMIVNSTACEAKVDEVNPNTGAYRIVLQGTLDLEENRFE